MGTDKRRGQALIELALGMFALALVLAALFAFAAYSVQSLDAQRKARSEAGTRAVAAGFTATERTARRTVELDALAADYVFGRKEKKIEITEKVYFPPLKLGTEQ